jgi:hypothetical protein
VGRVVVLVQLVEVVEIDIGLRVPIIKIIVHRSQLPFFTLFAYPIFVCMVQDGAVFAGGSRLDGR